MVQVLLTSDFSSGVAPSGLALAGVVGKMWAVVWAAGEWPLRALTAPARTGWRTSVFGDVWALDRVYLRPL